MVDVWQKNVLQIRGDYSDVRASTLYDVIHDPIYRSTWDPNILEGKEICRIDNCNDIGYYASKFRNLAKTGMKMCFLLHSSITLVVQQSSVVM